MTVGGLKCCFNFERRITDTTFKGTPKSMYFLYSFWDPNITCRQGYWPFLGYRTLLMNLLESVDPLFRKMCMPKCTCQPTQPFHVIFEALTDILELLCILTRSWFSLHLHTSRCRDLTTWIAGQLWMPLFLSVSSWDFLLCMFFFPLVLLLLRIFLNSHSTLDL